MDNQWISIKDRFPEDGQDILIYKPGSPIATGLFNKKKNEFWCDVLSSNLDGVTHWMPLPAPPESP